MELGLGLRTCFTLETKNPLFVNFKLSPEEVAAVQKELPPDWELQKVRFTESETEPHYWISYNSYEIMYPRKELQHIRRIRLEINTFVKNPKGQCGIFVFSGSPFVSSERLATPLDAICEFAERLVVFIYGCGKLIPLSYQLTSKELAFTFQEGLHHCEWKMDLGGDPLTQVESEVLSEDYWKYNDVSFFNSGKTFDRVFVSDAFRRARFHSLKFQDFQSLTIRGPFFKRSPDSILFHRGAIPYLVDSMNRTQD